MGSKRTRVLFFIAGFIFIGLIGFVTLMAARHFIWMDRTKSVDAALLDSESVKLREAPKWNTSRKLQPSQIRAIALALKNSKRILIPSKWEPVGDVLITKDQATVIMITYSHSTDIAISREVNGREEWRGYFRTATPLKSLVGPMARSENPEE